MMREMRAFLALAALLSGQACSGPGGEEPLYVLRDALGRSVAIAGRSQLADAAPGTMMRASIGGVTQDVVVGERVGMGPVIQPAPAPPAESPAVTSAALVPPPPVPAQAVDDTAATSPTTTPRGQAGAAATGTNPSGRRREATPRAVSRSVM